MKDWKKKESFPSIDSLKPIWSLIVGWKKIEISLINVRWKEGSPTCNVMEGFTSRTPNENSGRDRLNTEWAPGIIISSGLTRFLPAELCFRSGIYSCTVRARWLIIELESHVHFPPVFSRAPPPCSCFSNGTPRPSMTPLRRQKILFLPFFIPDLSPTWWFFFVSRIQAQHVECIISSFKVAWFSFRIIWIYYRVKYIYK